MTPRTAAILAYIRSYHLRQGYAPTRREMAHHFHLSTSVVSHHLRLLQDAGKLTVARDIARGIVLVEETGISK